MGVIVELLIESGLLGYIILFFAGVLVDRFIAGTKHMSVFVLVIKLLEDILESYDIDVPDILIELLSRLHEEDIDSIDYEDKILDEINKKKKQGN